MKLTKRILAIDDDALIRGLVRDYLGENGFEVLLGANGDEMNAILAREQVDLVVLDVKLPGEDGFSLARALRSRSNLPIIMLTGQGQEIDRVAGLELGADDYLTKPFSPRELLARIRAVLRRREPAPDDDKRAAPAQARADIRAYRFSGWELALGTRRLKSADGRAIELTNSEFALLATFLRAPRIILSRDQLLEGSRMHADIFDRSIDVQILRLRRKLEPNPNEPRLIVTRRGAGYLLDSEVEAVR
jgi:two-component system, OmpR family, response regulator